MIGLGTIAIALPGRAVSPATPAIVPDQMGAPTVVALSATQVQATLATAPNDNGFPITSYDLRHSSDGASWAVVVGVTSPVTISGYSTGQTVYVQTAAVSSEGRANWSASGLAATHTVPAQMSAPTVTATSSTAISVDRANAPDDGGSAIQSYDLRYSTDQATWTTFIGMTDPQAISSLTASTTYYAQTRAVNGVGPGDWSASGFDTTSAAVSGPTFDSASFGPQSSEGEDVPLSIVNLSEDCDIDFILTTSSQSGLSHAQVQAGTDSSDVAAASSGSGSLTSGSPSADLTIADGLDDTFYINFFLDNNSGGVSGPFEYGPVAIDTDVAAAALAGYDTAQEIVNETAVQTSHSGTLTGVSVGDLVLIHVHHMADSGGTDPTNWVVQVDGNNATAEVLSAASGTTADVYGGVFSWVSDAAGDLTVTIDTVTTCRAHAAYGQKISGYNATTPIASSAKSDNRSAATSGSQPNAVTPAQAGNAFVSSLVIKGGSHASVAQTGFDTTIDSNNTGTNSFNDLVHGIAGHLAPDTSAVTCAWSWSTADDHGRLYVEINKA